MNLHEKFLNSPTVDFSILSKTQFSNSVNLIHELIKSYDEELIRGKLTKNSLKSYHMLLCNEYHKKRLEKSQKILNLSTTTDLFLKIKQFSHEELLIIYDIIILKLILFTADISKELENFQINFVNSFEEKEAGKQYMKIIECFLDAFELNQKMGKSLNLFISRDLEIWYQAKDSDWKSLISILPKLIKITGLESLDSFWNFLLRPGQDLKNSLTGLCIFIDAYLKTESQQKNLFLFSDKRLWEIILNGLRSRIEFERKESLYLFKIITEFLEKETVKRELKPEIFSCSKKDFVPNYILILESLEEKQQHMVIPSLQLLNSLISANCEHQKCGNCFDFPWLLCIFEKILQHENNAVIKYGISLILKLNPQLYDDRFLKILTETLNNRFLYESEDQVPKIVTKLEDLFIQAENLKINLLPKFLSAIADISWDPVSIFYVTFALRSAAEKIETISFPWKEDQLMKIKCLVEKNLKLHSPVLRKESQTNIIIAITRFADMNLKSLGKILSFFPNETFSEKNWKIILDSQKIEKANVEKFVEESCRDIREGNLDSVESFATILVILCDLKFLKRESRILLEVIDLLNNIQSIKSRPYMNYELADRILELIYWMILRAQNSDSSEIIYEIISPYFESGFDFLLIRKKNLSYEKVQKYTAILNLLVSSVTKTDANYRRILEEGIYSLENYNASGLQRIYGINFLRIYQKSRDLSREIISRLINVSAIPMSFEEEESLSGIKGKATTEYYTILGKIMNSHLEKSEEIFENWISFSSSLFDKAGTSGVPFVIGILSQILEKGLVLEKDQEEVKLLVRTCWKSIFEGKKNRLFWAAFDKLLKLILNPKCFGFEDRIVDEFITEILKEGEAVPNIKIELLKNLENLDPRISLFQKSILDCLLHGQVLRRDVKIELQTIAFLKNSSLDGRLSNHNQDSEVRARAIILIFKAITSVENYSSSFFPLVMAVLRKFKGKRYFGDSNSHRIQQRLFQLLLILEPFLDEASTENLEKEIVETVLSNADQLSIQIMMSWILTRIYARKTDKTSLWNLFKEVKEKRPGNLKFVAGVIFHVSKLLKGKEFESFAQTAISHLAPECLGPTFNTRLACQIVILKLYEVMQKKDILSKAILEIMDDRNFKIANEFYYNNFHSLENYSLESIYYEVPRLTSMNNDELIPPKVFETLQFSENKPYPLKLFDDRNSLSLATVSTTTKFAEKEDILSNDLDYFDLQKKIIPEKSPGSNEINKEEGIIVIASLVEKVPNLGGIARTCEIFGASELVLASKKIAENKEFQSLSVTAEKWIKVTEVKPPELSKYLLEMQEKGWKLVGLEQTAYSSNLLETKFEKKTLLLLGNEKDGIPPHLIPILDTCVEIPQIGVIRSLNVHVTGAICIWEYAKQHSFKAY
ncbi:uncharacterized protein LOC117183015 [Belonocnema kinseyi]|uniref:uncharacterized protein LOC117183015 n=1 Tax=Belonocnema kinseyi TaxID=2817044 RepID=UPI00143DAA66|nr:uncharacterized protein LOC117183015 [Belonocnema kinseyi]